MSSISNKIDEHIKNILAYQLCNDSAYETLTGQEKMSVDQATSALLSLLEESNQEAVTTELDNVYGILTGKGDIELWTDITGMPLRVTERIKEITK